MNTWTAERLGEATPETELWAATYLDGLPTRYKFSPKTSVKLHNDNGKLFRHAFNIVAAPEHERPGFAVWLFKGANANDKRLADGIIKGAQRGRFSPRQWQHLQASERVPYARYVFGMWLRGDEPRPSNELRPCTIAGCAEDMHEWNGEVQDDPCQTEGITHPSGYYFVRGWRFYGEEWTADVTHNDDCFPEGRAGLKVIRDLANDFAWVQQECERLNERNSHADRSA